MVHRETVAELTQLPAAVASIAYNNVPNIIPRKYAQKKYIIIIEQLGVFFLGFE
jgi:hypothetical protein